MADWATVRTLALALPEAVEDTTGRRAYRIRGKLFAWEARERDGGGLAVRVERDEKQLILDANPDVYFTSPHYAGYPRPSRSASSASTPTSSRSASKTPG